MDQRSVIFQPWKVKQLTFIKLFQLKLSREESLRISSHPNFSDILLRQKIDVGAFTNFGLSYQKYCILLLAYLDLLSPFGTDTTSYFKVYDIEYFLDFNIILRQSGFHRFIFIRVVLF